MKICLICKKEITPTQGKMNQGLGWIHTACLFPKTIKVTQGVGKTGKKFND